MATATPNLGMGYCLFACWNSNNRILYGTFGKGKIKMNCELENEKYNKPCPYNPEIMCVQMPCEPEDDNLCGDGCPNYKSKKGGKEGN